MGRGGQERSDPGNGTGGQKRSDRGWDRRAGAKRPGNWVLLTAVALIALQLVLRAVLAFQGYFYWDDLILTGRAGTQGLLSPSYLFDDHDGHVMPAAFLIAGGITRLAPLNWLGPALSLIVLQLVASLALLRALRVILGWRPVLLAPLAFALFTPLGVPAYAWWAAALNSLPMIAALAWVCADAILLVRTGNQRYAVTGVVAFLAGLLFFEKAAVIPFVAFAVAALLAWVTGDRGAVRTVWRRGLRLWVASLVLTAAWVGVYLVVVDQQRWSFDLAMTWDLLRRSVTHGIVPGLAGGPWDWQRWAPASPWATPPLVVMLLGWAVLAAALAVSMARKERIGAVWLVAVSYAIACQVPIYLMRSSRFTALELAQTLRYLPDLVVVLALLSAVAFCAPNRASSRWLDASSRAHRRNRLGRNPFHRQQRVLDGDVHADLARQSDPAVSADRPSQPGPGERHVECPHARPGGRPADTATRRVARESGQPHVRAAAGPPRVRFEHHGSPDARHERTAASSQGDLGALDRAGSGTAVRLLRPARRAGPDAARRAAAAVRIGRPRSTTSRTTTAR